MQDFISVFTRIYQKMPGKQAPRLVFLLAVGLLPGLSSSMAAEKQPVSAQAGWDRIAIVIDDLGNQPALDAQFIDLPGSLALSFLPDAPATASLARAAHAAGKPVLLHLPMAGSDHEHAEKTRIEAGMTHAQVLHVLRWAIQQVPYLEGINNHQGSDLTRRGLPMQWLMQELAAYPGLYFLDSRTTADSIAEATAETWGVPTGRRHVFLDNSEDPAAIDQQLQRLATIAHRQGQAIAIGHPNAATLRALKNLPEWLQAHQLRLVSPAQLMHKATRLQAKTAEIKPEE
jgi:polysaccharide deacetylase 2 family uncharacterized protein YibQ